MESGITATQQTIIDQSYYSSQTTYAPRYYQRIAINRTLDAIAKGQDRLLLVMATGTGKTYTAFQIVYRLLQRDMKKKILNLADRNILVDQSIQQDFAPLEKVIHKINVAKDDRSTITSHQVYFSLYQQLVGDDDKEHFRDLFSPDFFDLIIVDECHRGSAKEESRWRKILEYFNSATQIGILYNNDKYYLLGIAAGDNEVRTYRVDKMDGVASMKAPRHAKEIFEQVDLADYTQYTFSMYTSKPEKVRMLFNNGYLTVARDRFGYDVHVKKDDDSRFEMEVLVAVSPQFYGWIFGLGDKVEIAEAPHVREGMKETLELIRKKYDGMEDDGILPV